MNIPDFLLDFINMSICQIFFLRGGSSYLAGNRIICQIFASPKYYLSDKLHGFSNICKGNLNIMHKQDKLCSE